MKIKKRGRWDTFLAKWAEHIPILGWEWFYQSWWGYLLARSDGSRPTWRTIKCRMRGHPCGVVYWNPSGYEPDMSCKNCGDDLG